MEVHFRPCKTLRCTGDGPKAEAPPAPSSAPGIELDWQTLATWCSSLGLLFEAKPLKRFQSLPKPMLQALNLIGKPLQLDVHLWDCFLKRNLLKDFQSLPKPICFWASRHCFVKLLLCWRFLRDMCCFTGVHGSMMVLLDRKVAMLLVCGYGSPFQTLQETALHRWRTKGWSTTSTFRCSRHVTWLANPCNLMFIFGIAFWSETS